MRHIHSFAAPVVVGLACAACGSSSSGTNSDAFIGTWQYTVGTETDTCNGQSSTTTITGTFQIQEGTTPGTLEYIGTGGCNFAIDVDGDTATGVAGSMCTQMSGDVTSMETLTSFTATLSGTTLTVTQSASAVATENGATEDCTSARTATLTQIAK